MASHDHSPSHMGTDPQSLPELHLDRPTMVPHDRHLTRRPAGLETRQRGAIVSPTSVKPSNFVLTAAGAKPPASGASRCNRSDWVAPYEHRPCRSGSQAQWIDVHHPEFGGRMRSPLGMGAREWPESIPSADVLAKYETHPEA